MSPVRGRWFPASVVLPGDPQPWQRCYVIAADDGLHVFRRAAEQADWHAPADWSQFPLPRRERDARNGFAVQTQAGLVVVTLSTGCKCGVMGRWAGPSWARTETIRA